MEVKQVVAMVVGVALVVILGFLVVAMAQGWLADGGLVADFFKGVIESVTTKAQSLISGFTS